MVLLSAVGSSGQVEATNSIFWGGSNLQFGTRALGVLGVLGGAGVLLAILKVYTLLC